MTKRLVQLKEVEVYKADRRSRVWRVVDEAASGAEKSPGVGDASGAGDVSGSGGASEAGGWVVKRFEYWSLRQVLGWLIGMHPGQFEIRRNRKLRQSGVPVVAIEDYGLQRQGGRWRFWLATKYEGISLHDRLKYGQFADDHQRAAALQATGELLGLLVRQGVFFRDFKAGNVMVSDDGAVKLIDVGGARGFRRRQQEMLRMAELLDRTLEIAGATAAERQQVKNSGVGGQVLPMGDIC